MLRVLLVLQLLFSASILAAVDTVVARVSDWPPYFWQEKGSWKGMDVEFYQLLEKESGLAFSFDWLPWSRGIDNLKSGQCTIMTQLSRTPEREAFMVFIGPYTQEEMVLVVKKERAATPIRSLDQLAEASRKSGLQVGYEEDAFYSEEFHDKLKEDAAFRAQFTHGKLTMATMVANDRLFGFFDQRPVISYKIRNVPEYRGLVIHPFLIGKSPIYFGVSKKAPEQVITRLQRAFDQLMQRKAFLKVESKWTIH